MKEKDYMKNVILEKHTIVAIKRENGKISDQDYIERKLNFDLEKEYN